MIAARWFFIFVLVLAATNETDAQSPVTSCHLLTPSPFPSPFPEDTYIDYNGDGYAVDCYMASDDLNSEYECGMAEQGVCIHSTMATARETTVGFDAPMFHPRANVTPFEARVDKLNYIRISGKVTVKTRMDRADDVVIVARVLGTKWEYTKIVDISNDEVDDMEISYAFEIHPHNRERSILLVVVLKREGDEGEEPTFFLYSPASLNATRELCDGNDESAYADTFDDACFPQLFDVSGDGYIDFSYSQSNAHLTRFHLTSLPPTSGHFYAKYDHAKQDMALIITAATGLIAFVGAMLVDMTAATAKRMYRRVATESPDNSEKNGQGLDFRFDTF